MSQTSSKTDLDMMRRAIALSLGGYPAPNPHVGCVLAHGERVVGEGFHNHAGGPHAEIVALKRAGDKAAGATAYVTLEPCNHHGRTPPCVDALLKAGVARVVAACPDPYGPASGGLERLANKGVHAEVGLLQGEARAANLKWLTAIERGWPYVVVKAAMTLDGRIATPSGSSKWISGKRSRAEAHRLRAECGAVLIGRGTAETDDPHLTVRDLYVENQPVRIVLDPYRKIPATARMFDDEARSIRVVSGEAAVGGPMEIEADLDEDGFRLEDVLRKLYAQGVTGVLVEGGARTAGAFIDAGYVDRLELFIAPKVFGAGPAWAERQFSGAVNQAERFRISKFQELDGDLWVTALPVVRPKEAS